MLLKSVIAGIILSVSTAAYALPWCKPFQNDTMFASTNEDAGMGLAGYWAVYECVDKTKSEAVGRPVVQVNVVLVRADYATFQSIGGKLDTANKALANFLASWQRNVTLPYSDPSLDDVRKLFLAAHPEYSWIK